MKPTTPFTLRLAVAALALLTAACSDSLTTLPGPGGNQGAPPPTGTTGVGQAGAQDFGLFRQILEDGELPAPDTLDAMGFFAEHKFDYAPAACGGDICLNGLVGMMGNMINGNACTILQLGMTSPIDVSQLERPPLDLAIAVDVSGSMSGQPISFVRDGLHNMLEVLEEGDRITLIAYSDNAQVRASQLDPIADEDALREAIDGLRATGSTNIYDGLFSALTEIDAGRSADRQARVVLLSDGVATTGITDPSRFASLAQSYAELGIGITSIGVGTGFDVTLMRSVSDVGAGNFYFLENPQAVTEVFAEEAATFMVPLALDVQIDVAVNGDFMLRDAYGTRGWTASGQGGSVEIPALFLAGRTEASDPIETGRRGGGGAILIELLPEGVRENPAAVAGLSIGWTDPVTGERHGQSVDVANPIADGQEFPGAEGMFSHPTVEKGFVALNIFAGFDLATQSVADGDLASARGTLEALRPEVAAWLSDNPDPDIEDDLVYVDLFIDNLAEQETQVSAPLEPWPMGD
jgi:Ca-activated chloride channel family protein